MNKLNLYKPSVVSLSLLFIVFLSVLFLSSCKKDNETKDSSMMKDSSMNKKSTDNMKKTEHNMDNMFDKNMSNMMNKMHTMKMSGNLDVDFVTMMIMHHQGAIDMASAEISSGKQENVKSLASNIIKDQKSEIQTMQDWLEKNKDAKSTSGDNSMKLMQSMNVMMKPDMKMSGDTDKDFLTMMIIHHQGAIDMASVETANGTDSKIKKMAEEIIKKQKTEIEQMKQWQK